jgi:hypothetical protein
MGTNSQTQYSRIAFVRELYKWAWKWVWVIIWVLPYALVSLYDLLQGQGYLPSNWPTLGQFIPIWVYFVFLAVGVLVFIGLTLEGAYRIVKTNLRYNQGNDEEISRVTKQLSELHMKIKGDSKNYSCMLMECADKLAVGGITIGPPPDRAWYCLADDGQLVEPTVIKGMGHSQLLGFLQQLVIEGIVERKSIGEAPYYEETFYLTEFGRQIISRLRRLSEKN